MLCQLFRVSALQLPIRRSLGRRTITLGATYLRSTRKTWSPQVEMYVRKMVQRYDNLCQKMTSVQDMDQSELKDTSKSMNELAPVKQLYERLLSKRRELLDLSSTVIDDEEFGELLKEEIQDYRSQIHALQQQLVEELSPTDADDKNSAVLEVRAGTGGKEASLFAAEIYAMYQKFAHSRKWKVEVLSESYSETGGLKDASASITGENVFGWLKHEVGVHRVQRVPITEAQGRIHTSTITVAVLPQPYDIDIVLNQSDIKIEAFRSSGAGGQHVNTTDSAVRVTHLPTGITVACQEDRSQLKNKNKAIRLLRAKLYNIERQRTDQEQKATRKGQIGTGDRSERIRTFNFLQDRITDHRVNITLHGVEEFLEGGEKLTNLIDEIRTIDRILAFDEVVNLTKNT